MAPDLWTFLNDLTWQQILTILSITTIIIGAIRYIVSRVNAKFIIEIQEKEWRNYAPQVEGFEGETDIRLSTHLLFHNKLGKDTTLNEIRLEREGHDPITLSNATSIQNNHSYPMHHIWELGQETSIKGKLVIKHTHGESSIPLDQKIPVPIDDLPKHGIQVRLGKTRG